VPPIPSSIANLPAKTKQWQFPFVAANGNEKPVPRETMSARDTPLHTRDKSVRLVWRFAGSGRGRFAGIGGAQPGSSSLRVTNFALYCVWQSLRSSRFDEWPRHCRSIGTLLVVPENQLLQRNGPIERQC